MLYQITILVCLIVNFFLIINFDKIAHIINLFDEPDNKRKLHKNKVALLGGSILSFSLLIFSINFFSKDVEFFNTFNFSKKNFFVFIICSYLMFLIGFYDDKKSINPNLKLLLVFFVVFLYTSLDGSSLLLNLKFSFINQAINLKLLSIPIISNPFL